MNGALARYCTLQVYRLHITIIHRNPPAGILFHADRGARYISTEFRDICRANGARPAVGRTGIGRDHLVAESFFATLKKELIHPRPSDY